MLVSSRLPDDESHGSIRQGSADMPPFRASDEEGRHQSLWENQTNNRTFGGGNPIDVLTRMFETRVALVFRTENYDGHIRAGVVVGLQWRK